MGQKVKVQAKSKQMYTKFESNHLHLFVSHGCHSFPHVPGAAGVHRTPPSTASGHQREPAVYVARKGHHMLRSTDPLSGCYKITQNHSPRGTLSFRWCGTCFQKIAIIESSIQGSTLLSLNHMFCDLKHSGRCLSMFQSHSAFTTLVFFVLQVCENGLLCGIPAVASGGPIKSIQKECHKIHSLFGLTLFCCKVLE